MSNPRVPSPVGSPAFNNVNSPIPVHVNSPLPVRILVDNHLSNSDKISIGSLVLSLLLIIVTLYLVLADRSMVRQSELAMRHDSLLDLYTVMLAGMRTMRLVHEWRINSTNLEVSTNPMGISYYRLVKPQQQDYKSSPHPKETIDNFTSQETTARMKLLQNDQIASKAIEWRDRYTDAENDWFTELSVLEASLNSGTQVNANPQLILLGIKQSQKVILDELLALILELATMMQKRLIGQKSRKRASRFFLTTGNSN